MREVLETTRSVAKNSNLVRIDLGAMASFAKRLLSNKLQTPPWEARYHFYDGSEKTVAYFLVLDTLNFCFWAQAGEKKWEFRYGSETLSGYYAMAASLHVAVTSNVPITEALFLSKLTPDKLKQILGGQGELQLINQRASALNELGHFLVLNFKGNFCNMVESADSSAVALARILADNLSSFRDISYYGDERIYFYKRAQILTADLYGAFKGKRWGTFTDINKITAFADYKLPQVLRHLGILHYAQELCDKVDNNIALPAGSPEEVEIRACTIQAVELLRQYLAAKGRELKAFQVDWILWNMGQEPAYKKKPYHRTTTIFY